MLIRLHIIHYLWLLLHYNDRFESLQETKMFTAGPLQNRMVDPYNKIRMDLFQRDE